MTDLTTTALTTIKNGHYRLTKQRRHLVDLLVQQADHYVDITAIDDQMRQEFPGISHNTIYRNLAEFKELGLVEITRKMNCKAVKFRCERPHHHHFICQKCGKVQEVQMPDWRPEDFEAQLGGGKILGHSFELYGECAECRKASGKAD